MEQVLRQTIYYSKTAHRSAHLIEYMDLIQYTVYC